MLTSLDDFRDPYKNKGELHKEGDCPDCGNQTVNQGGCDTCPACGWSKCSIA